MNSYDCMTAVVIDRSARGWQGQEDGRGCRGAAGLWLCCPQMLSSRTAAPDIGCNRHECQGGIQTMDRLLANDIDMILLQVPYTIVRTHSDILHRPVQSTGNSTWVTASQDLDQNFEDGFAFAIATGSTAVLVALQNRCHAANGVGAAVCNYALAPTVAS